VARFKLSLPDRFSTGGRRRRERGTPWPMLPIFICQLRRRGKKKSCEKEREGWSRKPARNGGLGGRKQSWGLVEAVAGTHVCLQNLRIRGHRLGQAARHPCPSCLCLPAGPQVHRQINYVIYLCDHRIRGGFDLVSNFREESQGYDLVWCGVVCVPFNFFFFFCECPLISCFGEFEFKCFKERCRGERCWLVWLSFPSLLVCFN
jgi:hypothetical protein